MQKAHNHPRMFIVMLAALSIGLLPSAAPSWSETESVIEVSPAAAALLKFINTAPEKRLSETPGLNAAAVKKVMAHRGSHEGFKNLVEFSDFCGIERFDLETLLKPYQEEEKLRQLDANRKEIPTPPSEARKARLQKNAGPAPAPEKSGGAEQGDPTAGPIGMVKPGFYTNLPGFDDLDKIDPLKKTEFLETVNREMCSCGCKGETVAFCLVNDPKCPVVAARAKKIYDDITTKAPR